jgi:hypothetical protein
VTNRNARRHDRIPYIGPVRISWEDANGHTKYAFAKCLDVSESGLRIEGPEPVSIRATVSLRAERINFAGSATIKHVTRTGSKYILGLEMSQTLRDQAKAIVREPWGLRRQVSLV